ncbi:hypothetical protein CEXT_600811 [Caerostris extrusa]|uniref:Uncharacterized protein n=1 Tax=Caerostris extrusa TaxID=172846 RepID=A0AAV4XEP2_CAEEX|nr:hypothetical protein CEXT_600811 [Caerostris extrusa]
MCPANAAGEVRRIVTSFSREGYRKSPLRDHQSCLSLVREDFEALRIKNAVILFLGNMILASAVHNCPIRPCPQLSDLTDDIMVAFMKSLFNCVTSVEGGLIWPSPYHGNTTLTGSLLLQHPL